MITFDDVVKNSEIKELMKNAQKQLDVLGYTEHSRKALYAGCGKGRCYFREAGL